jgi:hypothetical protein
MATGGIIAAIGIGSHKCRVPGHCVYRDKLYNGVVINCPARCNEAGSPHTLENGAATIQDPDGRAPAYS